MTYPCATCGAAASADTGCPACGRGPDPDAIEVIRTDAEISELIGQLAAARRAVSDLEWRIGQAWQRRHAAAARVRAAQAPPVSPRPGPEAATRLVQNILFLLGGLLLAVAAIVFTAVAWAQFGVGGRAALLAFFTVAALAVPPLALRRKLTATAETAVAVGLLLVLLDGYAAWYVDLFGVAGGSPLRYAGVVCAVTAALAAGYARLTGLAAPRWAALLAAQPALPLVVAPAHPGPAGWTLTFGGLAAANFACRQSVFGVPATLVAIAPAFAAATATLATAVPVFHADRHATVPAAAFPLDAVAAAGWRLPAALALAAVALAVAVPSWWRGGVALAGAAAVALALPAGLHLPWWNAPVLDLVVVAVAVAVAVRQAMPVPAAPAGRVAAMPAAASPSAAPAAGRVIAAVLGLHAVAVGFGRPGVAAGVLAAVAVLGFATAATARRRALGDTGLFLGMLVAPAIAWTATAALGLPAIAQCRAVAAAAGLLAAALPMPAALRMPAAPGMAVPGTPAAPGMAVPGTPPAPGMAVPGTPAAPGMAAPQIPAALRPITAGLRAAARRPPALVATLVAILPLPLWALAAGEPVAIYAALGLLFLAVTGRSVMPFAAALGAVLLLAVGPALVRMLAAGGPADVAMADGIAVLLAAAVAALTRRWVAVPVFGLSVPLLLAAAGVPWPLRTVGFLVLGVAAAAFAVAIRRGRAAEAAAHTTAALALVLTAGYFGYAAAVCMLWGLVLGVRALRPAGRSRYLIAAAAAEAGGWLLLMTAAKVAVLEAYTIGIAVFALFIGLIARRERMSSWVAYGPALAAALLPSLASVLVADGQYVRRLLLGLGALATVVAGATFRLRAPVIVGGGVLAVAALRELAAVWDLIPRWIPLAAGGLVLVVLATTLERRRRDLARFRRVLGRMT